MPQERKASENFLGSYELSLELFVGTAQVQDALDETDDCEDDRNNNCPAQEHIHQQVEDADPCVAKVELMNSKQAQEPGEKKCDGLVRCGPPRLGRDGINVKNRLTNTAMCADLSPLIQHGTTTVAELRRRRNCDV